MEAIRKEIEELVSRITVSEIEKRIKQDKLEEENEENKRLKEWIDKMAEFILNEHYMMTYVDERQWREKKKEIIREICIGE